MRNDPALAPARIFIQPNEERFKDTYRRWQGIPSIEVTSHGRSSSTSIPVRMQRSAAIL